MLLTFDRGGRPCAAKSAFLPIPRARRVCLLTFARRRLIAKGNTLCPYVSQTTGVPLIKPVMEQVDNK
jgi:hypothetical protein